MSQFQERGGRGGGSFDNDETGSTQGEGLPEDVLDAATGAAGRTGSGGPTDASDLGQFRSGGDLAERDAANEGLNRDGGTATMGTDIGETSA